MYYVYIITNRRNGTLYTGVTNQLWRRVREHRNRANNGFTQKYGLKRLIYYEAFGDVNAAIGREKQLKKWQRRWKLNLIESLNPQWLDLYETVYEQGNAICFDPVANRRVIVFFASQIGNPKPRQQQDLLDPGSSPG
jgi:putative endonuclease